MNEQKMREAFDEWCRSGDGPALFNGGVVCDDDTKDLLRHWMECTWIAATTSAQRDAMAVAEAVMYHSSRHFHGGDPMPDLAAIVESVRPGKPDSVNQQLLAALIRCRSFLSDPANFDCYGSEERLAEFLQRVKLEENEAIAQADAAIAAAEAAKPAAVQDGVTIPRELFIQAMGWIEDRRRYGDEGTLHQVWYDLKAIQRAQQPATAQQQGEPVAWIRFCSDGCHEGPIMNSVMEDVRKKSGAWSPLYTTPPAQACSVPVEMGLPEQFEDDGYDHQSERSYVRGWNDCRGAMLAAAPKGGAE